MHSEVGIGSQSLPYGLQNEIMYNPCSNGGLGNNMIGYTKFNEGCIKFCERCTKFCEGCTKFCERCTKRFKVRFEVGINPQLLLYGFQNEIVSHPYLDGGLGSNRIECTKFNEGCIKFCEGCTKGSKVRSKWGLTPNHFLMGF